MTLTTGNVTFRGIVTNIHEKGQILSILKKCLACGKTLTGNRKYCPEAACQRAAAAARQARTRANAKAPKPVAVVPVTVGPVATPWGEFACMCAAWADAVILAGFRADPGEAVAWLADEGYDGHAPNTCPVMRAA